MKDMKDYAAPAAAGLLIGAGIGAGLMYFFDPNRGRARRARLEDQGKSLLHRAEHAVEKMAKDVENRAEGLYAETRRMFDGAPVEDEKLAARVRARLGRLTKKPHDIAVEAHEGRVTLGGEVDAAEAARVLTGAMGVAGVHSVDNQLKLRNLAPGPMTSVGLRALGAAAG